MQNEMLLVLVLEDDVLVQDMVRDALSDGGFETQVGIEIDDVKPAVVEFFIALEIDFGVFEALKDVGEGCAESDRAHAVTEVGGEEVGGSAV